jgi:hypothetical protein
MKTFRERLVRIGLHLARLIWLPERTALAQRGRWLFFLPKVNSAAFFSGFHPPIAEEEPG